MKPDEPLSIDLVSWSVAGVFLLGLLVLAVRLKSVQIDAAADYSYASSRQSERRVQTDGIRGRILDRRGLPLAENRRSLSIACDAACFQRKSWDATVRAIAERADALGARIGRACPLNPRAIRRHVSQTLAMPLVVWRDVDERTLARFCENERDFPGFFCRETDERTYPYGELASHALGYVGRDQGEAEAGDEKFNFYRPEMRGRSGLEVYYDSYLRGVSGEERVLVDARGFAIRRWTVVPARKGPDLTLSIDARIQLEVERQLKGLVGACVALDPRTGDVLALASAPSYNPNAFVPTLSVEIYDRYAKDPLKPLLNRASGGAFAPGSIFKPVTALAGLAAGVPASHVHECTGLYVLSSMHLHCSHRWGHGQLDMRHALSASCNPYFCDLGVDVGTNALVRAARALGLGAKTGIDLGCDVPGVVPDAEWKERVYREPWYAGDLAQMSIGQGMLLVSPLQMARVAGAIATGFLVTPHLRKDAPVERKALPFTRANLDVVREGMRMVVDGGTGKKGGEGVAVAVSGKTGTAEVGRGERRRKNTWFMAYAPSENPTIAIAMIVENGQSGGGTTAPKVAAVLRRVFGEVRP